MDKPFFLIICGCPRSGTYLLSTEIQKRFDFAIPIENYLIESFSNKMFLWGDLKKINNAKLFLRGLVFYTKIWIWYGSKISNPEKQTKFSLLPVIENLIQDEKRLMELINKNTCNKITKSLFIEIFHNYAQSNGYQYFGDKCSKYFPIDLMNYQNLFENVKVIHIVRDGRDVCLSWRAQWFGPKSNLEAIFAWKHQILKYQKWGTQNERNYLEIKFENLINLPDETFMEISQFLGMSENTVKNNFGTELAMTLSQMVSHKKISGHFDNSKIGIWRTEMSQIDIEQFSFFSRNLLENLDYSIPNTPKNIIKLLPYSIFALLKSLLLSKWIKRSLQKFLPYLIWFYLAKIKRS